MVAGERSCMTIWCWFATIFFWSSIFFTIAVSAGNVVEDKDLAFGLLVISGLIYYITAFCCSSTCSYLMNPTSGSDIYSYMQNMFYTPVQKIMRVQCYHYEYRRTHTHVHTGGVGRSRSHGRANVRVGGGAVSVNMRGGVGRGRGQVRTTTQRVRVNTHSASEPFYYISWRDISGQFLLNTGGAIASQKLAFVKLRLRLEMIMAEDGTRQDYERQRQYFRLRNRFDVYQDYSESTQMSGFNEYNLVRVSDYKPPFFGISWYILATMLGCVEFYKMYVDKFCIPQEFVLRKVVSTRRDLNSTQVITEYTSMIPCITYMGEVRQYAEPTSMAPMAPPPVIDESVMQNVDPMYAGMDAAGKEDPSQDDDSEEMGGGYPSQPGGYPSQPGGYPSQPGGYPSQPGGYSSGMNAPFIQQ